MPDSPRPVQAKSVEREARLAEVLRSNLRRRKKQARARAADRDTSDMPAEPCERQPGTINPTG